MSWWRAVGKYPATWAAIAAVLVAEWLLFSWFDPPLILAVILIALGIVAIVTWPIAMSATGTLNQLRFPVPELTEVDADTIADLEAELSELEDPRPARQLQAIQEKRDNLTEVLKRRLDAGELTYARYLTTAQQVYIAALDNLHEVGVAMRSISAIDDDYINGRLEELDAAGETNEPSDERERVSLEDRRALRVTQGKRIATLLAQNESAMTGLDKTATALADAPIGRRPENAEAAMAALEELAERASKYATD